MDKIVNTFLKLIFQEKKAEQTEEKLKFQRPDAP